MNCAWIYIFLFYYLTTATNIRECLSFIDNFNLACTTNFHIPTQTCCLTVSLLNVEGCFCHPFVAQTFGERFNAIATSLRQTCNTFSKQPMWWYWAHTYRVDYITRDCRQMEFNTFHETMCEWNDFELETARINTLLKLRTILLEQLRSTCFDFHAVENSLIEVMQDDAHFVTFYGSEYTMNISTMVEMLSFTNQGVARGALQLTLHNPEKVVLASIKADDCGERYVLKNDLTLQVGQKEDKTWCSDRRIGSLELVAEYLECNDKIARLSIRDTQVHNSKQPTALPLIVQALYTLAAFSSSWNVEWLCHVHETNCIGGMKQFASTADCLNFMYSLPIASPVCGESRILAGNSLLCRVSLGFLLPIRPKRYCPAIGNGTMLPSDGVLRCHDTTECIGIAGDSELLQLKDVSPQLQSCLASSIHQPPPPQFCPA